jgi:hypothetical protein
MKIKHMQVFFLPALLPLLKKLVVRHRQAIQQNRPSLGTNNVSTIHQEIKAIDQVGQHLRHH